MEDFPIFIIVLSSLVSGLFGAIFSTWIYIHRENRLFKIETLKKLAANRHNTSTGEFAEALNEILIVFNSSPKVLQALSSFQKTAMDQKSRNEEDLITLFRVMCDEAKIKFTESDIELFLISFDTKK